MNTPINSLIASDVSNPDIDAGFKDGWTWRDQTSA